MSGVSGKESSIYQLVLLLGHFRSGSFLQAAGLAAAVTRSHCSIHSAAHVPSPIYPAHLTASLCPPSATGCDEMMLTVWMILSAIKDRVEMRTLTLRVILRIYRYLYWLIRTRYIALFIRISTIYCCYQKFCVLVGSLHSPVSVPLHNAQFTGRSPSCCSFIVPVPPLICAAVCSVLQATSGRHLQLLGCAAVPASYCRPCCTPGWGLQQERIVLATPGWAQPQLCIWVWHGLSWPRVLQATTKMA